MRLQRAAVKALDTRKQAAASSSWMTRRDLSTSGGLLVDVAAIRAAISALRRCAGAVLAL
jgi:hypothetical protein